MHPGQRGPGPCFLNSPRKIMKHQMDVGDIKGELEIHYASILIRSQTTTSAQMHWSSHPHILEYRVFRSSEEDSVLKKPSREQRV